MRVAYIPNETPRSHVCKAKNLPGADSDGDFRRSKYSPGTILVCDCGQPYILKKRSGSMREYVRAYKLRWFMPSYYKPWKESAA